MKIFGAILLIGLSLSGNVFAVPAKNEKPKGKQTEAVVFKVNMTCENCKKRIEKNVSWEKGVKNLSVDLDKKTVTILFDTKKTNRETLKKAIEKLGYTCEMEIYIASPGLTIRTLSNQSKPCRIFESVFCHNISHLSLE
ncbi:MAG: heavy-metal-associated domain-containing protein [Dysgonamonadaceae bacterium]|jgi:copper chaperone CopZ|nr:heavy-metal-associated domain-containing protein [Dysgonamonadaceae bacterium]